MKFRLMQARLPSDPVRYEERVAFAAKLQVPVEDVVSWDLLTGVDVDALTDGYDAVLVGGSGEFGVCDDAEWLPAFFDALAELCARRTPLFGSCFGFQGLVVALGGTVRPAPEGSEVGSYEMSTTNAAAIDPVFCKLPAQFTAQEGHKDMAIELPSPAVHLVRSERCEYQALRVRNCPVWATQFHPELSGDENAERFARYFDIYKVVFGEEVARQKLQSMRPSPHSNSLLRHFKAYLETL